MLVHSFTTYSNISLNDLRKNDATMNIEYDSNFPIDVLFDQIKNGIDFAVAGNSPKNKIKIKL